MERPDGEKAEIEWVGKEVTVKTAWLYLEIPLAEGPEGSTFTNRLLFEVEPDQVNTMVFGRGKDRASLRFTRDDPKHTLRRPEPPKPNGRLIGPNSVARDRSSLGENPPSPGLRPPSPTKTGARVQIRLPRPRLRGRGLG